RVAADLDRDVAAQPTEKRDILALGRFAQAPPDMQLVETVRRPAAAFDEQCRLAEMTNEVVKLGRNVSGVEVDQDRLHLLDIGGLGLADLGDRSRHYIEGRPFACCPTGEGNRLLQQTVVDLDPSVVGSAVDALAL